MNTIIATISKLLLGGFIRDKLIKEVRGKENLPKGGFILACNHLSHSDWFACGYVCAPHRFTLVGQVDQYNSGANAIWRRLIYWWGGVIPIDRKSDESKKWAMEKAVRMLKGGYRVIIYPEGGRAYDGVMKEFKPGVGKMHLDSEVTVVPMAITGTREILPPHGKINLKKAVTVNIGKPMMFKNEIEAAKKLDKNSEGYKWLCVDVTRQIEKEVRELYKELSK